MCKRANIHIGTSGWSYKHWRGNFYPENISEKDYLKYYSGNFCTVEINTSFYRLPQENTIKVWTETVPEDFIFSAKASRYITHMKKLTDPQKTTPLFFERIQGFKDKLGPILFQLPPHFEVNPERLKNFLKILPENYKYAFEFRDSSWFNPLIYEILREHNIAFCIYNLGDYSSPKEITADFVYIRYHGPINLGQGMYNEEQITKFSNDIKEYLKSSKEVYCYFNNDDSGFAPKNAEQLKKLLNI